MVFGYLVNVAWVLALLVVAVVFVFGVFANGFLTVRRFLRARRNDVPTFCPCLEENKIGNICQRGGKMCKKICDCPDGDWGPCDGKGWCNIKGGVR